MIVLLFEKWHEYRAEQKRRKWLLDLLMRRFANELYPLMLLHAERELRAQFTWDAFENNGREFYFKPKVLQALQIRRGVVHAGVLISTDERQKLFYAHPTRNGLHVLRPLTARKLDVTSLRQVLSEVSAQITELEAFQAWKNRARYAPPKRSRYHQRNRTYEEYNRLVTVPRNYTKWNG